MNITLIGFKNCGKTSIAKLLADKLNKLFIDTDDLIEKEYSQLTGKKANVREIYNEQGATYFRDLETKVIATLIENKNCVVATGGGSVLNKTNIVQLKKNSKLIYLNLPFEILMLRHQLDSTPAFIDKTEPAIGWQKIFDERKNIYLSCADIVIETYNETVEQIADKIGRVLLQSQYA